MIVSVEIYTTKIAVALSINLEAILKLVKNVELNRVDPKKLRLSIIMKFIRKIVVS